MIKKNHVFLTMLVFSIMFFVISRAEAEVTLTAKVDKERVAVGEKMLLTAKLEWEQVENEEIRITKINIPRCSLLELIDSSQASRSELRLGRVVSTQTLKYIFKAKKEGIDKISALTAEYIAGSDEQKFDVSSESIEIKVISLKEKLISGFGFIAAITAGTFAGIMCVFLLLRKWRKKQNAASLNKYAGSHYEREAIDRLRDIIKYRLEGDFKKYYGALHRILADYAKAKHRIEIANKDEEEIRRLSYGTDIPGEFLSLLVETVRLSERVRFAGYELNPDEERKVSTGIQKYLKSSISNENDETI